MAVYGETGLLTCVPPLKSSALSTLLLVAIWFGGGRSPLRASPPHRSIVCAWLGKLEAVLTSRVTGNLTGSAFDASLVAIVTSSSDASDFSGLLVDGV
jgi:hypothetical protein